jgi:hypothetical protein
MSSAAQEQRRRDLAAIHAEAKVRGLDEDTRRDIIERVSGGRTRSAGDLDAAERAAVIDQIRGRPAPSPGQGRPKGRLAASPTAKKARALWLALADLGELDDASERALAGFCKRQAGIDSLAWISPEQGNRVIEALRARCGRAGFEPPQTGGTQDSIEGAKQALVRALWARLADVGAVKRRDGDALDAWCGRIQGRKTGLALLTARELDRAAAELSAWLRAEMAARGLKPPLSAVLAKGGDG